tara:strand:- start:7624 stop:8298 length:675 start_codon:yes stop_codon:yes gene_type:complete
VERIDNLTLEKLNFRLKELGWPSIRDLIPVLAYGANASPSRLAIKFQSMNPGAIIPVIPATLHDFDIVFASHFSSYGSIPATLQESPGTRVSVSVTWFNEKLLERMNETELGNRNYVLGSSDKIYLDIESIGRVKNIYSYWTKRGCLLIHGSPISLKAILASNRKFIEYEEREILEEIRKILSIEVPLENMIVSIRNDSQLRKKQNLILTRYASQSEPCAFSEE